MCSLSFLAPSYFLNTNCQGLLYEVDLNLQHILENCPPTACVIPFILRRGGSKEKLLTHVFERFTALIEDGDMKNIRKWIGVIVDIYSKSENGIKWDFETTASLVSKSSLLSRDVMAESRQVPSLYLRVPASCEQVITQSEMLIMFLLPNVMAAIDEGNSRKLKFMSSLSVHYLVEMEQQLILPCVALQCLVIALLCRTGQDDVLSSFLHARQTQWAIMRRRRQMNLPTIQRMYFDNPGAIAFADRLFLIATDDHSGIGEIKLLEYFIAIWSYHGRDLTLYLFIALY